MTNQQFLKEIHQYIDNQYKQFEQYQQIVKSILLEFDRLCQKKNIKYVLAYGNAIGAVRDHGQLPWDYDVDLLVSFDEKKELIEALQSELSEDFYYVYHDNTPRYPAICLRVCKKGYTWLAFHVDVFFYTGAPDSMKRRNVIVRKIIKYRSVSVGKNYPAHRLEKTNPTFFGRLQYHLWKIKHLFTPADRVKTYMEEIGGKYPVAKSNYIVTFGGIKVSSFKKELFEPLLCNVDGYQLPIPKGYDEYLREVYRDYMSYLPVNKRFEEFYKMSQIVEKRQKIYEQQSSK